MTEYNNLNIRHFKLLNGEQIIALVSSKNEDNVMIERPVSIQENVMGGWRFSHWFPFSDKKVFKILNSSIMNHSEIENSLKGDYIRFVMTPIPLKPPTSTDLTLEDIINELSEEDLDSDYDKSTPKGVIIH